MAKYHIKKRTGGRLMVCVKCGKVCAKQNMNSNYDYCCLCLPVEFITRPIGKWICYKCGFRVTKHYEQEEES